MTASDADRAKAAELLHPGRFTDRIADVAAALAAERAAAVANLRTRVEALAADFDANGNSCALGDPTAETWHKASNLLRAAIATDTTGDPA